MVLLHFYGGIMVVLLHFYGGIILFFVSLCVIVFVVVMGGADEQSQREGKN